MIRDFDVTDASNGFGDRLKLSRALLGGVDPNAEDILANFASETSRGIKLDFGGGDTVHVLGLFDRFELQFSIDVIA